MIMLADRTECANYALSSHEAKAGDLRIGDVLDIGDGARIVRIQPVVANWPRVSGSVVYTAMPDGSRKIRSYDNTDTVALLVRMVGE